MITVHRVNWSSCKNPPRNVSQIVSEDVHPGSGNQVEKGEEKSVRRNEESMSVRK